MRKFFKSSGLKSETPRRVCGTCNYCMTTEGHPYYCLIRDLYYFVNKDDEVCSSYVELNKEKAEDGE